MRLLLSVASHDRNIRGTVLFRKLFAQVEDVLTYVASQPSYSSTVAVQVDASILALWLVVGVAPDSRGDSPECRMRVSHYLGISARR